jgi:TM2 domain-containing membrane protein YozV
MTDALPPVPAVIPTIAMIKTGLPWVVMVIPGGIGFIEDEIAVPFVKFTVLVFLNNRFPLVSIELFTRVWVGIIVLVPLGI